MMHITNNELIKTDKRIKVSKSLPCPAAGPNICCFRNLIYSLFCKLHTSDRLIILYIDCILVFIV